MIVEGNVRAGKGGGGMTKCFQVQFLILNQKLKGLNLRQSGIADQMKNYPN